MWVGGVSSDAGSYTEHVFNVPPTATFIYALAVPGGGGGGGGFANAASSAASGGTGGTSCTYQMWCPVALISDRLIIRVGWGGTGGTGGVQGGAAATAGVAGGNSSIFLNTASTSNLLLGSNTTSASNGGLAGNNVQVTGGTFSATTQTTRFPGFMSNTATSSRNATINADGLTTNALPYNSAGGAGGGVNAGTTTYVGCPVAPPYNANVGIPTLPGGTAGGGHGTSGLQIIFDPLYPWCVMGGTGGGGATSAGTGGNGGHGAIGCGGGGGGGANGTSSVGGNGGNGGPGYVIIQCV